MSWDFETDEDYQKQLDWVDDFVSKEGIPVADAAARFAATLEAVGR